MLPLRSDRVVLRLPRRDDAPVLAAYRSDPTVAEYQSWTAPYPLDRALALIDGVLADGDPPPLDTFTLVAISDPETDELLGDLAYKREWDGRSVEFGYTLAPTARGRGVATEAARLLLDHLFATTDLHRAHAELHPDNVASARVLERLGLVYEGTDRQAYWTGDVVSDSARYGVLRDEWHAWHARPTHPPVEVRLVPITPENRRAVRALAVHRSQERLVSSVAVSLGDALVPDPENGAPVVPWYRAVEADGELAAFVMVADVTAHHPDPFLWRFLVDRRHQRRGIGERVVRLVAEHFRARGASRLFVSYHGGPGSPAPFYARLGFVPTGELEGEEHVAVLELT